jgi:hypothetical protein
MKAMPRLFVGGSGLAARYIYDMVDLRIPTLLGRKIRWCS